jgi:hypothetical protein
MPEPAQTIQELEAVQLAWTIGRLAYLYRAHQFKLFDAWEEAKARGNRKFLVCNGRGWGKSTFWFIVCLEWAISHPNTDVYFVAPVEKKLDDYLEPIRKKVFGMAPDPKVWAEYYSISDNTVRLPNNSRVLIRGCNHQSYDDLRGGTAGLCVVDEGRGVDNLVDLVDNILMPANAKAAKENRANGYTIVASTPPPTTDHPLESYYQEAELEGNYFHASVLEADYPDDILAIFKKEAGGENSLTWRIEYMAERGLVDDTLKIVPSFDKVANVIRLPELNALMDLKQHPEYQFYRWFEGLDIGTVDKQVLLAGFYSFLDATLYVVFERTAPRGETTKSFGDDLTKIETDRKITGKVYLRVCDTNGAQLAMDLFESHRLVFHPTEKGRLVEMVNKVEVMMGAQRIMVSEECPFLIGSLYNCVWKDHLKKEFARSKTYGHGDAVATLMYMVRNLVESNPIPHTFQVPTLPGTNVIPPWTLRAMPQDPSKKAFGKIEQLRAKLRTHTAGPVKL